MSLLNTSTSKMNFLKTVFPFLLGILVLSSCSDPKAEALQMQLDQCIDEKLSIESQFNFCDSCYANLVDTDSILDEKLVVQNLAKALTASLMKLGETREPNEVLRFFSSSFAVTKVNIDLENEAQIARYTAEDFKAHLKEFGRARKHQTFNLQSLEFLSTDLKGNIFNVVFKTRMDIIEGDKLVGRQMGTTTITGRKTDKWYIANLSNIVFDFEASHSWE